jgi:uncharacterized membrane protein
MLRTAEGSGASLSCFSPAGRASVLCRRMQYVFKAQHPRSANRSRDDPMQQRKQSLASLWRSTRMRPRLFLGSAAALAAFFFLPHALSPAMRCVLAWNTGGLVYLVSTYRLMNSSRVETIKTRAARQDDGRTMVLVLILCAIAASFLAIAGLINEAKQAKALWKIGYLALAASTIFVSWMVTQVAFTLHYAHEYYAPTDAGGSAAGLTFPDDPAPDFWDFFYFATSIGATSQTSDVAIKSKSLRRLVAFHAIVSFFFNTTVLALTINLAASLI